MRTAQSFVMASFSGRHWLRSPAGADGTEAGLRGVTGQRQVPEVRGVPHLSAIDPSGQAEPAQSLRLHPGPAESPARSGADGGCVVGDGAGAQLVQVPRYRPAHNP